MKRLFRLPKPQRERPAVVRPTVEPRYYAQLDTGPQQGVGPYSTPKQAGAVALLLHPELDAVTVNGSNRFDEWQVTWLSRRQRRNPHRGFLTLPDHGFGNVGDHVSIGDTIYEISAIYMLPLTKPEAERVGELFANNARKYGGNPTTPNRLVEYKRVGETQEGV